LSLGAELPLEEICFLARSTELSLSSFVLEFTVEIQKCLARSARFNKDIQNSLASSARFSHVANSLWHERNCQKRWFAIFDVSISPMIGLTKSNIQQTKKQNQTKQRKLLYNRQT